MSQPVHITRSAPDQRIAEAGYSGYDRAPYIDGDVIRRGLIHAFAYAEGIRREDVPRVSAEARRRWENRADRALAELRLLSAAYAAGQGVVLTRQNTGPTTREEVAKLSKSQASAYITSMKGGY